MVNSIVCKGELILLEMIDISLGLISGSEIAISVGMCLQIVFITYTKSDCAFSSIFSPTLSM